MRRIVRTERARQDARNILLYLNERNPKAAEKFTIDLDSRLELLAKQPNLGRARNELVQGLRSIAINPYIVYFLSNEQELIFVRILHGARDVAPNWLDDDSG